MLEDYLQRVANVLEAEPQSSNAETRAVMLPLPSRRERRLTPEELRSGLLDSLELRHCGLLPLIAERNSSLGKVMKPSLQLNYELQFFAKLQPCLKRDQQQSISDTEFSAQLQQIYRIKSANLVPVWWNSVFAAEAMERNLSLSRPPIPLQGNPGYGDSFRALEVMGTLAQPLNPPADPFPLPNQLERLESGHESLYNSEYGSQLFSSIALLIDALNRTALTLDRATRQRPLCLNGHSTTQAEYLRNVFDRYYGGGVQPYLSRTYRNGRAWLEMMDKLAQQAQPSVAWVHYHQQMLDPLAKNGLWQQFERAIQQHTRSWKQVLSSCGLMPGS
ncbi:DUF3080 family protein [Motiliproteus sp.]|uniref:DUF3080 family protein n=1 Tax=Motiliproteus sp. TaxID=1898955 RepID=UPI003BA9AD75